MQVAVPATISTLHGKPEVKTDHLLNLILTRGIRIVPLISA